MDIIVRNEAVKTKVHSVIQDDDLLYINKASKTAECANKYAHELRAEFIEFCPDKMTAASFNQACFHCYRPYALRRKRFAICR